MAYNYGCFVNYLHHTKLGKRSLKSPAFSVCDVNYPKLQYLSNHFNHYYYAAIVEDVNYYSINDRY